MARLPHAAHTLIAQVQAQHNRKPDTKAGVNTGLAEGEPDGFGVVRSVKFDKTSSKRLKQVLPHLDDPRITGFEEQRGQVIVHFSARTDADRRDPFALDDAALVAGDEGENDSD